MGDVECFENLSNFLPTYEICLMQETKHLVLQHMNNSIIEHFPDEMEIEHWVENPFVESLNLNNHGKKGNKNSIATESTFKLNFKV